MNDTLMTQQCERKTGLQFYSPFSLPHLVICKKCHVTLLRCNNETDFPWTRKTTRRLLSYILISLPVSTVYTTGL